MFELLQGKIDLSFPPPDALNLMSNSIPLLMQIVNAAGRKIRESLEVYWLLVRIIIPVSIVTEVLVRAGMIEKIAPVFAPVMNLVGLPSEWGLAWLTGMLVGIWAAVPLMFTLMPVSSLTVADVTIFSALILFAHALPIEQKIIQSVGPGIVTTTALRIGGGLLYAYILHHILLAMNWLTAPVDPAWIPMSATTDWLAYFLSLAEAMTWMLVILIVLSWALEILKVTGLLGWMMMAFTPVLALAGVKREAGHLTVVGLFLGISFGAGLLIREARSNRISPRQIFISCVFMGFLHSVIEDTLLMIAMGADVYGILLGRAIFAIVATAAIAALLRRLPDKTLDKVLTV